MSRDTHSARHSPVATALGTPPTNEFNKHDWTVVYRKPRNKKNPAINYSDTKKRINKEKMFKPLCLSTLCKENLDKVTNSFNSLLSPVKHSTAKLNIPTSLPSAQTSSTTSVSSVHSYEHEARTSPASKAVSPVMTPPSKLLPDALTEPRCGSDNFRLPTTSELEESNMQMKPRLQRPCSPVFGSVSFSEIVSHHGTRERLPPVFIPPSQRIRGRDVTISVTADPITPCDGLILHSPKTKNCVKTPKKNSKKTTPLQDTIFQSPEKLDLNAVCSLCERTVKRKNNGELRKHNCVPVMTNDSGSVIMQPSTIQPTGSRRKSQHRNHPPRRRSAKTLWIADYTSLLCTAAASKTKGDFSKNLNLLLTCPPPGRNTISKDTTTVPISFIPPAEDPDIIISPDDVTRRSSTSVWRSLMEQIRNNNFQKARRMLSGPGLADLSIPANREILAAKYSPSERPTTIPGVPNRIMSLPTDPVVTNVQLIDTAADELLNHIRQKKRGSSKSVHGLSNDDFQCILKKTPAAIHDLLKIITIIINDNISDPNVSALLLTGKGTALSKGQKDLRPIVTECPFL